MKNLILLSALSLSFAACNNAAKNETISSQSDMQMPAVVSSIAFESAYVGKPGEEDEIPLYQVALTVNGQKTILDTVSSCTPIPKEDFKSKEIPQTALAAAGGWWAGAGDYFYAIQEGNDVVVMAGWQDETQEDEGYHYKAFKKIPIKK